MSLLGKRCCKRGATKCHYVKSMMLRHKHGTGEGHMVKCMHVALEGRIKHNTLESAFVVQKSRMQGHTV